MSAPLKVALIDDDALVRTALAALIEARPALELIWSASSGDEALASWPDRGTLDVALVDLQMPGRDGIETCHEIRSRAPEAAVLIMTTFAPEDHPTRALAHGAAGFIVKDDAVDQLEDILRAAASGVNIFSRQVSETLTQQPSLPTRPTGTPLTAREAQVVDLLAQSRTNQQIARAMHVSEATVKAMISALITKLGCTDRVGIVAWAFRHGHLQ